MIVPGRTGVPMKEIPDWRIEKSRLCFCQKRETTEIGRQFCRNRRTTRGNLIFRAMKPVQGLCERNDLLSGLGSFQRNMIFMRGKNNPVMSAELLEMFSIMPLFQRSPVPGSTL